MMERIRAFFERIYKNESGQGMVEYILIILLIAFVAYVGFNALGGELNSKTDEMATEIGEEDVSLPAE